MAKNNNLKFKEVTKMANNCYVEGKIWSKSKERIEEFFDWLQDYKMTSVDRVTDIEYDEDNSCYSLVFAGDCKWSITSSINKLCDNINGNLTTKTDDIVVEMWSQEPGCGFEEHVIAANNIIDTEDDVDWEEYCVDEYKTIDQVNEEFSTNFTEDDIDEYGYCHTGGFPNWGEFDESKVYLLDEENN